jgi:putative transcriptional regulator
LDAIAHRTGPRRFLFALGCAGWGPGQLEAEIAKGDWLTVAADEALVFDEDAETKWERATARRRIDL